MVRYWLRREQPGWRWRAVVNGAGAVATGLVAIIVIESKFAAGRVGGDRRDPAPGRSASTAFAATTARSRGGFAPESRRSPPRRRRRTASCSTSSRSTLPSRRQSGTRARSRATTSARSTCPGRHTDPGILPRFRQFTGMRPDLEIVTPEDGRVDAVIEYLWALPRGESSFVTLVVPELFRRRSLVARSPADRVLAQAAPAQRAGSGDHRRARARTGQKLEPPEASCRAESSSRAPTPLRCAPSTTPATLGLRGHESGVLRLRRGGGRAASDRVGREREMPIPLEIEEAPFRDIGDPLLALPPRDHRRPRRGCSRGHAGADLQRARPARCTTSAPSTSSGCCSSSRA